MKFFFTVLICIFFWENTSAQNEKHKEYNVSLPMIEVIDSNFYHILDYILDLDKNCTYFSDSLWYSIWVGEDFYLEKKYLTFQFSGSLKKSLYLEFVSSYIGVLKYGNHYFFINGQILLENIFKTTNNQCFFNEYLKKHDVSFDDSWAVHFFTYYNGDYYFDKTINDSYRCK